MDITPFDFEGKPIRVHPGHLYIVHCHARGLCKVGRSENPLSRAKAVAISSGLKHGEYSVFISKKAKSDVVSERAAHALLATSHVSGEWFNCSFEKAKEIVKDCVEYADDDFVEMFVKRQNEDAERFVESIKNWFESSRKHSEEKDMAHVKGLISKVIWGSWVLPDRLTPPTDGTEFLAWNLGMDSISVLYWSENLEAYCIEEDEPTPLTIDAWMPIIRPALLREEQAIAGVMSQPPAGPDARVN